MLSEYPVSLFDQKSMKKIQEYSHCIYWLTSIYENLRYLVGDKGWKYLLFPFESLSFQETIHDL